MSACWHGWDSATSHQTAQTSTSCSVRILLPCTKPVQCYVGLKLSAGELQGGEDELTLESRSEIVKVQQLQAWRQAPVRAKPDKACTSGLVVPLTEPLYTLVRWEQGYELVSEQILKPQSADQLARTGRSRACCPQEQLALQ